MAIDKKRRLLDRIDRNILRELQRNGRLGLKATTPDYLQLN